MSVHDERRQGLLADRVLGMLDQADAPELDDLLLEDADAMADLEAMEYAAAAVALADLEREAMPAEVAARIAAKVEAGTANVVPFAPVKRAQPAPAPARTNLFMAAGWIVAAAAIALAIWAWLPRDPSGTFASTTRSSGTVEARGLRATTPESLLARAGTVRVDFANTKDALAGEASGDVVWSAEVQKGFMRIRGLPKNDPAVLQYQLWIFDKGRPTQYPVDGGVFDVASGTVTVPITAKLNVGAPVLFAITVEKPGGVVVSKREHIVLAAAIKG